MLLPHGHDQPDSFHLLQVLDGQVAVLDRFIEDFFSCFAECVIDFIGEFPQLDAVLVGEGDELGGDQHVVAEAVRDLERHGPRVRFPRAGRRPGGRPA